MEIQSAEAVIARIERELAVTPGGALAFDGDGTLWSGDVGDDYFRALLQHGDFRPQAVDAMRRDAVAHGLSPHGSGGALAGRIFEAYEAGAFPEEKMCEIMAWACAGWRRPEVDAFARSVVEGCGLAARFHHEALGVVEWSRWAHVEVLIVSASPRPIVEAAGATLGFGPVEIAAATPAYEADVMAPRVAAPIPYGPGKVKGVEECIGSRLLYAAFGDNAFDVAMLQSARIPVAIRPKMRLRDRAHEVPGLVELARDAL
jgi:phosphatidylglycerophosphatase C